jgi:DNA-binding LytR/AlgR family response regulator
VADYMIKPIQRIDLVKSLLKLKKSIVEDDVYLVQNPILDQTPKLLAEQKTTTLAEQRIPNVEQPLLLCIKSYGDYRYIDAKDICYFQADNNSTDIHLNNGEMVTAFKTLKHFEGILSAPFSRIHNSYIVNRNYISRIHTGNAVCYIKNTTTKIPFSKSYKENIDLIISEFANGNYLEI